MKTTTITISTAPAALLAQAKAIAAPAILTSDSLRSSVSAAPDQPSRKAALQALKQQRKTALGALNGARQARRSALDNAPPGEAKAAARNELVVARLAVELLKEAGNTGQGGPTGAEPTQRGIGPGAKERICDVTIQNAPAALLQRATARRDTFLEQLEAPQATVQAAAGPDAKIAARCALKTARKELMQALQAERKSARQQHDAAEAGGADRAAARDRLVVVRLAIALVKNGKPNRSLNAAGTSAAATGRHPVMICEVTVETAPAELLQRATARRDAVAQQLEALQAAVVGADCPDAKAAARAALKTARKEQMEQLHAERKSARRRHDAAETKADTGSARGQLIVARLAIALVKQVNGKNPKNPNRIADPNPIKLCDVTLESAPADLRRLAAARRDAVLGGMVATQTAVKDAADPNAKAAARKDCQRRRKSRMQAVQADRKAARNAYDAAETEADKASARAQLIVIRLAIGMVRAAGKVRQPAWFPGAATAEDAVEVVATALAPAGSGLGEPFLSQLRERLEAVGRLVRSVDHDPVSRAAVAEALSHAATAHLDSLADSAAANDDDGGGGAAALELELCSCILARCPMGPGGEQEIAAPHSE